MTTKTTNKAPYIAILFLFVVCCMLLFSNRSKQNKIDQLEQSKESKKLKDNFEQIDAIVVHYKNRVDSLNRIKDEISCQLDSISRRNEQRAALLQSYEQQIYKLKNQLLNEKRNLSDSSINAINSILPN